MSGSVGAALAALFGEPAGQSWLQLGELGLAFVLSALIGLEREFRQKSAGLRTYTLVGLSSALIMLISKYGFTDILEPGRVVLDPSRIAAQIVSGIGFIGGGVIFVRKDVVRGLTTAATVWLAAAIGMACGAGLPILALATMAGHFIVVGVLPAVERRLPRSRWARTALRISYWDGRGVLRDVLAVCTQQDLAVTRLRVVADKGGQNRSGFQSGKAHGKGEDDEPAAEGFAAPAKGVVALLVELRGVKSIARLVARLSEIDGVVDVQAGEPGDGPE
ncbi:MAG TPA: MgtC/SapB family protein [Roseiarcus sp.]|nr:MgtC/SapB family protein [Roseiarcus sp.]